MYALTPIQRRDFNRYSFKLFIQYSTIMKTFLAAIALMMGLTIQAQSTDNKPITTTFWVAGVCGMCEQTIERALDTKGVVTADFVLASNQLTITYKPKKISENQIHTLLNELGYDTEKSTCTPEQYKRVHGCCQYRELEKH
jgi:copper chaperone CopZ